MGNGCKKVGCSCWAWWREQENWVGPC